MSAADAHIQLLSPKPRFVYMTNDVTQIPCGTGTLTATPANPTPYTPGGTITVNWQETINHDGHFRIGLAPKGQESTFSVPTDLTIPSAPLPSWDLVDGIADKGSGGNGGTYSMTITLPNTECPACVLQVMQIASTANGGKGNDGSFMTNYVGCADISITAGGTVTPTGGTTGSSTTGAAGASGSGTGTGGSAAAGTSGSTKPPATGAGGATTGAGGAATGAAGAGNGTTGSGGSASATTTGAAGSTGAGGSSTSPGAPGSTSTSGGAAPTSAGGCSYASGAPESALAMFLVGVGALALASRRRARARR